MARANTSPAARLEALKRVKPRLRRIKKNETLTAKPMAELLSVNWPVLRGWCDDYPVLESSGAFVRGGNGIEWVFNPRAMVDGLIAEFTAQVTAGRKRAAHVRKIVAGTRADQLPEDMSLDEIAKLVRVARELREERQRQGELVERAKVERAIDGMVDKMQQAGLQAAREQDPTGQWSPDIAEKFENAVNSLILRIAQAGEDFLTSLDGAVA